MRLTRKERRSGTPWLNVVLGWSSLLAWCLFLVALILFHYARPEMETGLIRYFDLPFRDHWVIELKTVFLYTLWACCGLSVVNFLVNVLYKRRSTDHIWFNPVLLIVISLVFMLFIYDYG